MKLIRMLFGSKILMLLILIVSIVALSKLLRGKLLPPSKKTVANTDASVPDAAKNDDKKTHEPKESFSTEALKDSTKKEMVHKDADTESDVDDNEEINDDKAKKDAN